jgi:hypothetical protein
MYEANLPLSDGSCSQLSGLIPQLATFLAQRVRKPVVKMDDMTTPEADVKFDLNNPQSVGIHRAPLGNGLEITVRAEG